MGAYPTLFNHLSRIPIYLLAAKFVRDDEEILPLKFKNKE